LPRFLSGVNHWFKTPHWAIIAAGLISCVALLSGKTDQIIVLSVLGAIVMYLMSMASLFILRKKEPNLERPFASPFYPVFPAVALFISAVCLFAIMYYNFFISLIFFVGLAFVVAIFMLMGKHKVKLEEDYMMASAEAPSYASSPSA